MGPSFTRPHRFPGAFTYADPPYGVEFREYSPGGFSWGASRVLPEGDTSREHHEDQVELAQRLALHPGPVVLSGQATPRILELYERLGFGIRLLRAPRRIASNGDRTPALEVLAARGV